MYHEVTYKEQRRRRTIALTAALVVAVLALLVALAGSRFQAATREQGAVALRDSIASAAARCCAVEGSYPSSLSYLEQHYGLAVNHADYVIYYEWMGDNIPPSVGVSLR